MRNAIEYYYKIEADSLKNVAGRYFFNNYILIPKQREFDLKLYNYVINLNISNYRIIKNIKGEYTTTINNNYYVLLEKINDYKLNLLSLLNNNILLGKREIPWDIMWEEKLDYYEFYLKTFTSNKLIQSYIYYSGLTENAIKFYKEIKKEYPVYLSHLRLNEMDYLNPINFVVDYKPRDIAEYAKHIFFDRPDLPINLEFILENLESDELLLLFARMLYPSYYYDCYEKINNGANDEILDVYINKIEDYELLLYNIYNKIKAKTNIPRIDWIIKKDLSNDKSIVHPYQMIAD